ncbi:shikimate dehydrogenase [Hyphococcus flavus]|uniref:Shikimate dehydrogenase (NADP(+)) n=1 Tax=Hyphococcus flavus TaxID=1866326 RepID=A0AAE9ZD63_9PROT|nr:shikimate dehydrogenase [Hyphococcus flavus]WDI32754.1 shikimate dehydrogenase [Hyphococcus flavus]
MAAQSPNTEPKLAGVIGWPISQSLSPLIHTIWARRADIDGYYIPIPVEPDYDSFAKTVDSLRAVGFAGVNITIPHKEHALRYADVRSHDAQAAGAANMLTFRIEKAFADNSDIYGFYKAMSDKGANGNGRVLVLGAGGAARGVVNALKELDYSDITLVNRSREKADDLAEVFALKSASWEDRNKFIEGSTALINTTSLGMTGQPPLEIDLALLTKEAIVADIVYSPLETPLLKAAREKGCRTVDGLAMLMHQAAPGFETWFGGKAVIDDDLRQNLIAELDRRERT